MAVLSIDTLTLQGEGLGRLAGRVVFVPGALPGETVEVEPTEEKKSYSRGRLVRILQSSPERVTPPCPYFGLCGGCQFQHLPAAAQDRFKTENFRAAMAHALKLPDLPLLPLLKAPRRFHYRQRLRLKLGGPGHRRVLGFHQSRSHRIVPVDRCLLAESAVNDILKFLGPRLAALPPLAEPADLEIRLLGETPGAILLFSGLTALSKTQKIRLARHLKEKEGIGAVFFQDRPEGPLTGPDPFSPERHASRYRVPLDAAGQREIFLSVFPQVFCQVNLFQNRNLIALLLGLPMLTSRDRIWDLFCGQGNFSIPLSFQAAEVSGVESSAPAIENALWNQEANQGSRCRFIRATAREGLSRLIRGGGQPDWVLLDPPRAGAGTVMPVLAGLRARGILYISCEPMTLSRDLSLLLREGWRLEWTRPLDFFPQTGHLESLSLLRR